MKPIGRPTDVTADQTRAAIVAAAAAEFGERGYTRGSIRGIAQRAGLTSATLYYHFPTKLACLEAVQADALQILRSSWDPIIDRPGHIAERVAALLTASALINRDHPHMARISARSAMELTAGDGKMTETSEASRAYTEDVYDRLVAAALAAGDLEDPADAPAVRDMIPGLMLGLASVSAIQLPPDRYMAVINVLVGLLAGRLFTPGSFTPGTEWQAVGTT